MVPHPHLADGEDFDPGYLEALERLRDVLRRQADSEIATAMAAIVRREYGYTPAEIREHLGVSPAEMRAASLRLEKAARSLRIDQ